MTTDERSSARRPFAAALAAACVALAPRPASAQDPPPPLVPAEPDAPPPAPPAPDLPPRSDAAPPPRAPPPVVAPPGAPFYAPAPSARPPEERAESARMLRGHAFPTPSSIDSAFPQSHLGVGVELGRRWDYGVLKAYPPVGTMAMSSYTFQFDQAATVASQYLSFGVAVSDRVELGVSGSYQALLSTDMASSLVFGAKSAWTLRPGARFQLVRSGATALGLHLYGDFGGDNQQSPTAALAEIAAEAPGIAADQSRTNCLGAGDLSCALKNPGRVNSATTRTLAGGGAALAVAHAFSSSIGVQSAMGLEVGYRSSDTAGNAVGSVPINFHIGVAPSVDFAPKVPLGLMAEYLLDVLGEPSTGGGDGHIVKVQNSLIAGAYYTGRRDFSVGALFGATFGWASVLYSDGTSDLGPPTTVITGQVTARYFF